jgi:hypothetical protein
MLQGDGLGTVQDDPRDHPRLKFVTLDELGSKMKCNKCGKRPERYYPARQSDAPGFAKGY